VVASLILVDSLLHSLPSLAPGYANAFANVMMMAAEPSADTLHITQRGRR